MNLPVLTTGDDFFTREPNGKVTPLTQYYTRARGEAVTLATHQGKIHSQQVAVEAQWEGVRRITIDRLMQGWKDRETEWCIIRRDPPYTQAERIYCMDLLDEMTGHGCFSGQPAWKYSPTELLFQAADGRIEKTIPWVLREKWGVGPTHSIIFFRRLGDLVSNRVICSRTGNRVDVKQGIIPDYLRHGSPDDTWDYKMTGYAGIRHPNPDHNTRYTWCIVDHSQHWLDPLLKEAHSCLRSQPTTS